MKLGRLFSMLAAALMGAGAASQASAAGLDITFPTVNIPSHNDITNGGNFTTSIDVATALGHVAGNPETLNGIGWDVVLFANPNVGAFGGSWLSEITVQISSDPTFATNTINLAPSGTSTPGTETQSSGGVIKLANVALDDIVLPTGILHLRFIEGFDDDATLDDGAWLSGALTFQFVPAPGAAALLGVGGLVAVRRRRTR